MTQFTKKKKLVIVESPAKAKTIEKYLGSDYIVRSSVGHVRDLPKSNKKAIDIPGGFLPHYETLEKKAKVIHELQKLSSGASEVILATDPDREGEAIAWHIAEVLKLKDPKRIVFHEITKDAVQDAAAHPRKIDMDLKSAQEARRVLDRLVGYDLSGLIWKKVRYGLSAGRVQSPALRIIVEREREIRAFIPEIFWTITAKTKTKAGFDFPLVCSKEPTDEKEMETILSRGRKESWSVKNVKESDAKRSPRAPFTTSTLQQAASTRLGFSPSRTMRIAQRLYEAGHITYMRTDSTVLSKQAVGQILHEIENVYGKEYVSPRTFKTKSKGAQEAHEAIRPTNAGKQNLGMNAEQKALYQLIWQRTVASQMADAKLLKTKITANIESDLVPDFVSNGSRTLFPGWFLADPGSRGEDVELPKVAAGDPLDLISIESEQKETQPPHRYSEAGLVKELEKRGIGRPSTYATIISTIISRGYVEKEGKALRPTDTGEVVSGFLEKHFDNIIGDEFTAEMEEDLDKIASGEKEYTKILSNFYGPFHKQVESKKDAEKITNMGDAPEEFKCPECGAGMVWKLARNGKFMSCSRFPECTGARTAEGDVLEGPKKIGEKCPECGGELVKREGRFGFFISCENYPKCKFVKQDEEEEAKKKTGVLCPVCGKGEMAERRGRFGVFYGCSNYPKCKYAIKAKPTGRYCDYIRENGEKCGALMMEGTKTIPERCSDKTCPNHNPHKLNK
ncbi:MAG TPA: type I DNA topoisomerase [Candidatus Paceibacterota bacterium]|nr:type I DNA topoisomerase [Candidatus Paceibacterota bacterium]